MAYANLELLIGGEWRKGDGGGEDVLNPATGKATKWLREESPTWVNRPESPRWLADGTFLWLSERTGYQHVYRHKPGGELVGANTEVTDGEDFVAQIVAEFPILRGAGLGAADEQTLYNLRDFFGLRLESEDGIHAD